MEHNIIKEPDLVVALDIGSTYSGYAWQKRTAYIDNRSNVEFNTVWDSGAYQPTKTTSCVLLEGGDDGQQCYELERENKELTFDDFKQMAKHYKLAAFGHKAERRYERILRKNKDGQHMGKWFFFRQFKHLLYSDKFKPTMYAEDHYGQHVPLLVVMSMLIRGLKDHFTENFEEPTEKTLWVVTVPAIWSEEAKDFMTEAAKLCDIKDRNILLAKEPEAAAVYCMFLPQGKKNNMDTLGHPGQTFLTVDLGGLTADLSALEVLENGSLKEVVLTTGKLVGGQNINDAFFHVCQDSFRGDGWQQIFRSTEPVEMLEMEKDFESKKIVIGTDDKEDEYMWLKVPTAIKEKLNNKTITLKEKSEKNHCFTFEAMEFCFESEYIRTVLFGETCDRLYKMIKSQLEKKELSVCTKIVLVGGFSQSPLVRKYITENVKRDFPAVKVVSPTSPFQAVLKGAVIFGHDPWIFESRISRWTFGIGTNVQFDGNIHDAKKKWMYSKTGVVYCSDIFDIHIRKDESVKLNGPQKKRIYNTIYEYQASMLIPIYKSDLTVPKYITDARCKYIGYIDVHIPRRRTIRSIYVSMIYGGTKLAVIATDCETGQECKTTIKFENMESKPEAKTFNVSDND
ncbi:heat shock 70 kDa protein 12A-like [Mercenaria mercenaria]|uniref:heat shock 70 kDa protein 12A-like n=1 Tax=Mercenaria mercenaria TaxID=6596 RepID=UPI00234F3E43|nr:heat shock 70 kDa protein 12A-like [Mercenaria mercenaria]